MLRKTRLFKYFLYVLLLLICLLGVAIYRHPSFTALDFNTSWQASPIYPYIAVIIDDRATNKLVTAVLNVLQHIPLDWKVQIFTHNQHWSFYQESSLSPFIKDGRVFMTPINFSGNNIATEDSINLYLTSLSLWRQVRGDKVLLFQTDSAICSNSSYKLTDFLQYDFIGAPWTDGGCCNGGFSIRSRTKILLLLDSDRGRFPLHQINEDGWFSQSLPHFGGVIAPVSVAKTFAMESIYHPRAFAVHKSRDARPAKEDVMQVCAECPEARTIFTECGQK